MLVASRKFHGLWRKCATILCATIHLACSANSPSSTGALRRQSDFEPARNGTYTKRGWIGIRIEAMPSGVGGVLVTSTVPRSPAAIGGIRAGDHLMSAEDRALDGPEEFVRLIRSRRPGTRLTLIGSRGSVSRSFDLKIENSPDENGVLERTFLDLPAPALDGLASLSGEATPSWASLRGRIVVLDFWAPWCGVCHLISPELNRWQTRFGERLAVIGIAPGSVAQVAKSAPRFHMEYPVLADPEERVVKAFDAFAVPLVLVIDGSGVVRAISLGYSSQQLNKMERLVEKLLAPS
jgi:thiol-disulfide isomerase/thioredoxin